jgi:SAM-dependent methyltransferase
MNKIIQDISANMIERYSNRYRTLGYDVKTLGWGDTEQQNYRFHQTLFSDIDLNEKTILDIGCGFGDYIKVLNAQKINFKKYTGWDINPDLIEESKKIWQKDGKVNFAVNNFAENNSSIPVAEVAIMLGVLNLNFKDKFDNYEYSKLFISKAFEVVDKLLIVDFLSIYNAPDYPKEDFVFYHDPARMLEFALSLSPNVELRHNYQPIPQKEFMLFIYK